MSYQQFINHGQPLQQQQQHTRNPLFPQQHVSLNPQQSLTTGHNSFQTSTTLHSNANNGYISGLNGQQSLVQQNQPGVPQQHSLTQPSNTLGQHHHHVQQQQQLHQQHTHQPQQFNQQLPSRLPQHLQLQQHHHQQQQQLSTHTLNHFTAPLPGNSGLSCNLHPNNNLNALTNTHSAHNLKGTQNISNNNPMLFAQQQQPSFPQQQQPQQPHVHTENAPTLNLRIHNPINNHFNNNTNNLPLPMMMNQHKLNNQQPLTNLPFNNNFNTNAPQQQHFGTNANQQQQQYQYNQAIQQQQAQQHQNTTAFFHQNNLPPSHNVAMSGSSHSITMSGSSPSIPNAIMTLNTNHNVLPTNTTHGTSLPTNTNMIALNPSSYPLIQPMSHGYLGTESHQNMISLQQQQQQTRQTTLSPNPPITSQNQQRDYINSTEWSHNQQLQQQQQQSSHQQIDLRQYQQQQQQQQNQPPQTQRASSSINTTHMSSSLNHQLSHSPLSTLNQQHNTTPGSGGNIDHFNPLFPHLSINKNPLYQLLSNQGGLNNNNNNISNNTMNAQTSPQRYDNQPHQLHQQQQLPYNGTQALHYDMVQNRLGGTISTAPTSIKSVPSHQTTISTPPTPNNVITLDTNNTNNNNNNNNNNDDVNNNPSPHIYQSRVPHHTPNPSIARKRPIQPQLSRFELMKPVFIPLDDLLRMSLPTINIKKAITSLYVSFNNSIHLDILYNHLNGTRQLSLQEQIAVFGKETPMWNQHEKSLQHLSTNTTIFTHDIPPTIFNSSFKLPQDTDPKRLPTPGLERMVMEEFKYALFYQIVSFLSIYIYIIFSYNFGSLPHFTHLMERHRIDVWDRTEKQVEEELQAYCKKYKITLYDLMTLPIPQKGQTIEDAIESRGQLRLLSQENVDISMGNNENTHMISNPLPSSSSSSSSSMTPSSHIQGTTTMLGDTMMGNDSGNIQQQDEDTNDNSLKSFLSTPVTIKNNVHPLVPIPDVSKPITSSQYHLYKWLHKDATTPRNLHEYIRRDVELKFPLSPLHQDDGRIPCLTPLEIMAFLGDIPLRGQYLLVYRIGSMYYGHDKHLELLEQYAPLFNFNIALTQRSALTTSTAVSTGLDSEGVGASSSSSSRLHSDERIVHPLDVLQPFIDTINGVEFDDQDHNLTVIIDSISPTGDNNHNVHVDTDGKGDTTANNNNNKDDDTLSTHSTHSASHSITSSDASSSSAFSMLSNLGLGSSSMSNSSPSQSLTNDLVLRTHLPYNLNNGGASGSTTTSSVSNKKPTKSQITAAIAKYSSSEFFTRFPSQADLEEQLQLNLNTKYDFLKRMTAINPHGFTLAQLTDINSQSKVETRVNRSKKCFKDRLCTKSSQDAFKSTINLWVKLQCRDLSPSTSAYATQVLYHPELCFNDNLPIPTKSVTRSSTHGLKPSPQQGNGDDNGDIQDQCQSLTEMNDEMNKNDEDLVVDFTIPQNQYVCLITGAHKNQHAKLIYTYDFVKVILASYHYYHQKYFPNLNGSNGAIETAWFFTFTLLDEEAQKTLINEIGLAPLTRPKPPLLRNGSLVDPTTQISLPCQPPTIGVNKLMFKDHLGMKDGDENGENVVNEKDDTNIITETISTLHPILPRSANDTNVTDENNMTDDDSALHLTLSSLTPGIAYTSLRSNSLSINKSSAAVTPSISSLQTTNKPFKNNLGIDNMSRNPDTNNLPPQHHHLILLPSQQQRQQQLQQQQPSNSTAPLDETTAPNQQPSSHNNLNSSSSLAYSFTTTSQSRQLASSLSSPNLRAPLTSSPVTSIIPLLPHTQVSLTAMSIASIENGSEIVNNTSNIPDNVAIDNPVNNSTLTVSSTDLSLLETAPNPYKRKLGSMSSRLSSASTVIKGDDEENGMSRDIITVNLSKGYQHSHSSHQSQHSHQSQTSHFDHPNNVHNLSLQHITTFGNVIMNNPLPQHPLSAGHGSEHDGEEIFESNDGMLDRGDETLSIKRSVPSHHYDNE